MWFIGIPRMGEAPDPDLRDSGAGGQVACGTSMNVSYAFIFAQAASWSGAVAVIIGVLPEVGIPMVIFGFLASLTLSYMMALRPQKPSSVRLDAVPWAAGLCVSKRCFECEGF